MRCFRWCTSVLHASSNTRSYLKNLFAPLCGLGGLNLTAENAEKREEDLAMELPICIFEMVSSD